MASRKVFKINKQISKDSDTYDRDIIEKYLEYLEETGNAIRVGNITFDVQELVLRKFTCDTRLCLSRNNGQFLKRRSCCTEYAVRLSKDEFARIEQLLPKVKKHYPDVGAAIDLAGGFSEYDSWFDHVLRKKPEGTCMFLSDQGKNIFHCAIHGAALKEGKQPFFEKPSACSLFPLCYLEYEGGFVLTAYSLQNARVIEDENEPMAYDCCEPNPYATRALYVEMKDTIVKLLGAECYEMFTKEIGRRGLAS